MRVSISKKEIEEFIKIDSNYSPKVWQCPRYLAMRQIALTLYYTYSNLYWGEVLSILCSNDYNFNVWFKLGYKDEDIQPYHRLDFGDKYYKFEVDI